MSTYSSNTTIKVSGGGATSTNTASFAAPANGYAIVSFSSTAAGVGIITIGSATLLSPTNVNGGTGTGYVGPGITCTLGASSSMSWVIFINTP